MSRRERQDFSVLAVSIGRFRTRSLKAALLALLRRPEEELDTKGFALQALEQFTLADEERAVYLAVRDELEHAAGQARAKEAQPLPN